MGLACVLLLVLTADAAAQDPSEVVVLDTTLVADTLQVSAPDPPSPDVMPMAGAPPGLGVTGVPARMPAFATIELLDHVPGTWRYDLGPPGAPDGIALGLTPPQRLSLTLDGRPADDLFTGRPTFERLPSDLLAPVHAAPGQHGAPDGLATYLRGFVAEVPITELRYRAGPDGQQAIGVTHAQTRRPRFVQRLGGEHARLTALLHVSGDRAGGVRANSQVSGFHLVGRVGLSLPGIALEVTNRHLQREEGAWGGVSPAAPSLFVRDAPVRNPFAGRDIIVNDLALRARANIIPDVEPLTASLYWMVATHRFIGPDTTAARGDRIGLLLEQPVVIGAHRATATLDLRGGYFRHGTAFRPDDQPLPPEAHLEVRDSLALGSVDIVLAAGGHVSQDFAFPSGRIEVGTTAGPFTGRVAAFAGGARFSPLERLGFGDLVEAGPITTESIYGIEGNAAVQIGPVVLDARAEVQQRSRPRLLVVEDDLSAHFATLEGAITQAQMIGAVHLRPDAIRGLYASFWAAARHSLGEVPTELHRREIEALPEIYGYGRLGFRAPALFDGNLDLDVFARGRAWTAYRSRAFHSPTALYGVNLDESLPTVPASGVLDVFVEAGVGRGRARAFIAYENALHGAAYPGVFVVPIYPLPEPGLRIGVFWVLAN